MLGSVPVRPLYSTTLIRFVAVFGVGVALAVAAATAAALWTGRQEAIAASANMTASLARALTDAVARSVNSIDVTMISVADMVREAGQSGSDSALPGSVAQRLKQTPHLRQILVVGVDGVVGFDSAGGAAGRRMDVESTIEELKRFPRSLVIGLPVEGRFIGGDARAGGQSLIPVSSAVRNADGSIVALVVAAINPEHFQGIFHEIEQDTRARVQLWRFDGVLLAGASTSGRFSTIPASELPLFRSYIKRAEMGGFIDVDDDGILRITSYRTTLAWPLVVSVGIAMDDALSNWRANAAQVGWPVGLVTLAVFGLTVILVRTLARRARDEAMLRLSDRVLAIVSNGVTIADAASPDLPLLYVNQAFEQITGYSAAEALGRNARFLHANDADQEGLDQIREALAEGRSVTVKLRNSRADGVHFWNHVSLTPVRNAMGVITHWVGVQRDITQDEESRAALADAYTALARYSADMERFSFVLAHHLQEPARQMRLQAQLLMHGKGDGVNSADRATAERIIDASARLVELLRDVQVYLAVEREPVLGAVGSSRHALNSAIATYSEQCPGGTLHLDAGDLPDVAMPQRRLDDLFEILVENAVEFRHDDRSPRITVTVEPDGAFWRFRMSDNGIGIESCYLERIFIPLERLHLRSNHKGTGIGLAVARRITDSVHGRIWAESDGVTGSTFFFTLPKV
ncbi:PAS domain-containing protein [Paramagnetospirillum kuznetsovii]|uniref:PAS domain-containing protein n=1 Tax=Paramagnetospirillum kuznetsovii TaxID=2053833 RepID=UPI001EFEBD2E|nr:PAS domain-containing protein [Paramagnetospirillum kuznetsovii]